MLVQYSEQPRMTRTARVTERIMTAHVAVADLPAGDAVQPRTSATYFNDDEATLYYCTTYKYLLTALNEPCCTLSSARHFFAQNNTEYQILQAVQPGVS